MFSGLKDEPVFVFSVTMYNDGCCHTVLRRKYICSLALTVQYVHYNQDGLSGGLRSIVFI